MCGTQIEYTARDAGGVARHKWAAKGNPWNKNLFQNFAKRSAAVLPSPLGEEGPAVRGGSACDLAFETVSNTMAINLYSGSRLNELV